MAEDVEALHEEIRRLRAKVELLELRAAVVSQIGEEGVWDLNLETDEACFSPRLVAHLGYKEGELESTGTAFFSMLHPDDLPKTQAAFMAHLENKEPLYVADFRMRAKDGNWLDVQARGLAVRDENGKPVRLIGIQTDLTERHLQEREQMRNQELIAIQTEIIRSLGAPILQVWKSVLCVPIIGAVDEERASTITSELLDRVAATAARFVILDLTGSEFKAETAQYLGSMTRALRLIGAKGLMCGISPRTARTLIDLNLELSEVTTYRDLGDALRACLQQLQPTNELGKPV